MHIDISRLRIVLVNTSHPGNIGAAARAMKNMGVQNLYLVNPKDYPSGVAIGRAASALDILDNAVVVDTMEEAIADCSLVIGTSARSRSMPIQLVEPPECADKIINAAGKSPVALVFGREISGLSNEELHLCHFHVQIPTNPDYTSLNLAAAVMVLCYEVRKAALAARPAQVNSETEQWDQELATAGDIGRFLDHLEEVMVRLDFHKRENPRQLMRRLRRLYNRIQPDKMEINILRGILTATEEGLEKAGKSALPSSSDE